MGVRPSEEDLMRTAQGHGADIQEVLLRWPDRRAGTPREAVFVVSRQLPALTSRAGFTQGLQASSQPRTVPL